MSDNKLYEILGVSRSASEGEIRREYHKLAKRYHPDKSPGNEEKFKEIQEAYEILSDSEKRGLYDRFGMQAVKGESSGMGDFPFGGGDSIFSHLFGGDVFGFGGGGMRGRRRKTKGDTIGIPLEVSLEELYNGATKHVEYKRKELCKTCKGSGSSSGRTSSSCSKCRGSGIQVKLHQIGPGMMQQTQGQCPDCNGSGDFIRDKDRCKKCKGKRVFENTHKLEVQLTPGMRHEQRIPFSGEADEVPDGEAGDVLVILQQEDHPVFTREGIDLYVKKTINLQQALCGFTFVFEHLDSRKLKVVCKPGEVLSPNSIRGIEEEGMVDMRYGHRGNLYFKFQVEFPPNNFMDNEKLKDLEKLLPARPDSPMIDEDMEEVHMAEYDDSQGSYGGRHGYEAYHEGSDDEDSGGHGHRVGCQQQ